MNKILFFLVAVLSTLVMPATVQAYDINSNLIDSFKNAIYYVTDTQTKYTYEEVNIRKEPNTDSEILGTSMINTSFDVVLDICGWSMILTEDGYAFIKSEFLYDEPLYDVYDQNSDLYVLAHVLAGECQSYSDEEQRYVGSVVLNRVNHDGFPDTIKQVVFQKGQYSCVVDGNYYREPTAKNWMNAKWLLENGSILPDNVIWQSGAKQGTGVYLKTSVHYYCY